MDSKRILVVDDEQGIRDSLQALLSANYIIDTAENSESALSSLRKNSTTETTPSLILCDVMMPGMDGLSLLKELRTEFHKIPVIMISASKNIRNAVDAMKLGAVEFVSKPYDVEDLVALIEHSIQKEDNFVFKSARDLDEPNDADCGLLAGKHPLMQEVYAQINSVAQCDATVLITGESGTGKELVAQEIHRRSKRKNGAFVAINCAAIPESLIESELFGHERGAFTHAVEKRLGYFEIADGGTLFLDEIGELSQHVQVKMLRFLQEHEFYRVGRARPISVDVRIIAATNKNLENAVKEGRFRQDLFYRINVINLNLPALREKREDVSGLIDHFIQKLSKNYGDRKLSLAPEALEMLEQYSWPGNVRELENVIESLLALAKDDTVLPAHLPLKIQNEAKNEDRISFEEAGKAFEKELILKALKTADYVQTRAAEMLGISRRILKYKMDKLGIVEEHAGDLAN
jgi:DNA-binding NtrC family response regulator